MIPATTTHEAHCIAPEGKAVDLETRITDAQKYYRPLLLWEKAVHHVSDAEVIRRGDGLTVTMGGKLVLFISNDELAAPPDDEAFWNMLKSIWLRGLESWDRRFKKSAPTRSHGGTSQRGGGRPSWGRR